MISQANKQANKYDTGRDNDTGRDGWKVLEERRLEETIGRYWKREDWKGRPEEIILEEMTGRVDTG